MATSRRLPSLETCPQGKEAWDKAHGARSGSKGNRASEDTYSLPAPSPPSLLPFSAHTARRVLFLLGSTTRSRTRRRAVWRRGEADASKSLPLTATSTFTTQISKSVWHLQGKNAGTERVFSAPRKGLATQTFVSKYGGIAPRYTYNMRNHRGGSPLVFLQRVRWIL